jgi:predicted permease
MKLPDGVRRLFRLPRNATRVRAEVDDEVRFHLESRIEDLERTGASRADAERRALAQFGNVAELHEYHSSIERRQGRLRGVREWCDELAQDFRFGLRQLRRDPGFTAIAIVMAGLGIGANTAIFSILHHLVLAPLPFAGADRMVMLRATANDGAFLVEPTRSMVDLWRSRSQRVEHIVVFDQRRAIIGDSSVDTPTKGYAIATVPGALAYVGARPLLGRDLTGDDTLAGAPPVALISHAIWQRDYAESRSAVGQTIMLDGAVYTVIGVLPDGFALPFINRSEGIDIINALQHTGRPNSTVSAIGLMRPGVTAKETDRELAALFASSAAERAASKVLDERDGLRRTARDVPRVFTAADSTGGGLQQIVIILFGAVGLVLLIACANVANLLLARTWGRQREFAVRLALGASRSRVARQVLTESIMLAVSGGLLGIGIAAATLRLVIALQPAGRKELTGVALEPAVLAWSLALTLGTGVVFGIAPALFASGSGVSSSLKSSSRAASAGRGARRFRASLVMFEVALSVVLLASAGLLIRTVVAMQRVDVGFRPHGLSGIAVTLPTKRYADLAAREAAWRGLLERVRATPGVEGATYAAILPPGNMIGTSGFEIDGIVRPAGDSIKLFGVQASTPEFFAVAGVSILRGRPFNASTTRSDKHGVGSDEVLVSESFVQRFLPGRNPLGVRVRQSGQSWSRIVGVVPDIRPPDMEWADRRVQIFEPLPTAPVSATLIVRSSLAAPLLAAAIRSAAHDVDPSLKLRQDLVRVDDLLRRHMGVHRLLLILLGTFAGMALVLAAIGLYGVVAYSVSQRTRELGVRVALGAEPGQVMQMVLRQGMRLSVSGILVGTGLAIVATRALRGMLIGVRPGDPLTLGSVAVVLGAVAIGASYAPARRAALVDPVEALRAE